MPALTHTDPAAGTSSSQSMRFCTHCGRLFEPPPGHLEGPRRICGRCEMGVLLSCRRDALPEDAAPFLICTYELLVSAVSAAGERIFGGQERILGRQLLSVASCPLGDEQLARHVTLAAQRPREPVELPLRVRSDDSSAVGTLAARIATCGPPRAALVAVQRTGFGRR